MIIISYLSRVLLFIFIIFSGKQIIDQNIKLNRASQNLSLWETTENLYNLYESYSPYIINDLVLEDIHNDKIFRVYEELSNLEKSFIMNTINYERDLMKKLPIHNEDNIDYIYNLNIEKEEDLYSPYGKNIIVDKNYLKKHTITTFDGTNVIDVLDEDDIVLNILVPKKFKDFENVIEHSFKQWFYFQKVEVANIYREAHKKYNIELSIEELRINIIYIQNNLELFTYNPNTGNHFNSIEDSIITVYTENVDNSFLAACLGEFIFIESTDEYSALKEISVITEKYNITELNSIASVYDKKGEEIRIVESKINNLILNTIITVLFLIMFIVVITYAYYKYYFSIIVVKSLFGYSFKQIYSHLILVNLGINILVLFLGGVLYIKIVGYTSLLIVLVSIVDYLISKIVHKYLIAKGEIQFIKGE